MTLCYYALSTWLIADQNTTVHLTFFLHASSTSMVIMQTSFIYKFHIKTQMQKVLPSLHWQSLS